MAPPAAAATSGTVASPRKQPQGCGSAASGSSSGSRRPRAASYQAWIHAHVTAQAAAGAARDYGRAFAALAALETVHGPNRGAYSVYTGVGFFPLALRSQDALLAAYTALKARQVRTGWAAAARV
jgi:hypothetical protein